jgi:hypothetical protein
VIVDPTGSDREYFDAGRDDLAAAIRGWPQLVAPAGSTRAEPQLRIAVREVGNASYSPGAQLLAGSIPAIPGVLPLPSHLSGDLTGRIEAINQERAARAAALKAVRADALSLSNQIEHLNPPLPSCSNVWGAVSAASQLFDSTDRRLLVISDLGQNCHTQMAGSLDGVKILVVHICSTASTCLQQQTVWRAGLASRGASSINFDRLEVAKQAIETFISSG